MNGEAQGNPQRTTPSTLPTLKDYEILSELGRGGNGMVYKARQKRLDRIVALKVIRLSFLASDDEEVRARLEREARAAAQLSHPNIVVIYDFNQDQEFYYISMEYLQGLDLLQMVEKYGPLPLARACEYIRQAALGLQHAYEAGMVHRDIKPGNLFVTMPKNVDPIPDPRKPPVGTVKILDMGLVLNETGTENSQLTHHGMVVGTPDYISPEQSLDSHQVDIRADLYSLGCTFYFLLTGKPPYGEYKLVQKLMMHQVGTPRPLEELRPGIPKPVTDIVSRLMAKKPEDRFQTPAELADALTVLLTPKSTGMMSAPPPPTTQVDARPTLTSKMSPADKEAALAETAKLLRSTLTPTGVDLRETMQFKLAEAAYRAQQQTMSIPATADEGPALPQPKRFLRFKGHTGWVMALAFAPNLRFLASGGTDSSLRLWDLKADANDRVVLNAHQGDIASIAISPESDVVATGSTALSDGIRLWNCASDNVSLIGEIPVGTGSTDALQFSPDGSVLAGAGNEKTVRLWDTHSAKLLATLKGHREQIKVLAFHPDSKHLASADISGVLRYWDSSRRFSKEQDVVEGGWGQIASLAISYSGRFLAFGALDQKVYLWEIVGDGLKLLSVLEGHQSIVRHVQFNIEDDSLLSICDMRLAFLWEIPTGKKIQEWQLPSMPRASLMATFDCRYLAVGRTDGVVSLLSFYPDDLKKKNG
ncbi:MAG: hypothetical protein KatS3mg105_4861 [Gemmatales bacterium]|nr:MAG: hypothetical protein KatS3mg105_4861 [Gemmatales bacterium]